MKNMKLSRGGDKVSSVKAAFAKRIGKHAPKLMAAIALAFAGSAWAADFPTADGTFPSKTNGIDTSNATFDASTVAGITTAAGRIAIGNNFAGSTIKVSGKGGTIASVITNGGSGGRVAFTDNSTTLTGIILDGGIEANLESAIPAKSGITLYFDNASFFGSPNSYVNNWVVGAGGVRLNGSSNASYTYNGSISGEGTIYCCTGNDSTSNTVLGDTTGFSGTYTRSIDKRRNWIFGNGTSTQFATIGGTIGTAEKTENVAFKYIGNYSVGTVYGNTVSVDTGNLTVTEKMVAATLAVASGASLDFSQATIDLHSAIANSGTVVVAGGENGTKFEIAHLTPTESGNTKTYSVINGGTITASGTITAANVLENGIALASGLTASFDAANGILTVTGEAPTYDWNGGTSGAWDTTTQNWQLKGAAATFVNGSGATFATEGAAVTLGENIIAADVKVSSSASFTAASDKKLTATSIEVADGATLAVGGGLENYSWSSLSVEEGATLDFGKILTTSNFTIAKPVEGEGTVKVMNNSTGHSVWLNLGAEFTGTVDYAGQFNAASAIANTPNVTKVVLSTNDNQVGSLWGTSTFTKDILFKTAYTIGSTSATTIDFTGDMNTADGVTVTVGGSGGGSGANFYFGGTAATQKTIETLAVTFAALNITNGVNTIGTLNHTGGTIRFGEDSVNTIGLLNQNNGTITLGENTTLGELTGAGAIAGGSTVKFDLAADAESTFAGAVGAADSPADITVAGSGKQKFTGTLYLGTVTVVAGATLDLSGATVVLTDGAIRNSGKVIVAGGEGGTVFQLENLTPASGTYTLVTGSGTIDGWSDLARGNFKKGFSPISDRQTIDVQTAGKVTVTGASANLTWNGGQTGTWTENDSTDTSWIAAGSTEGTFFGAGDSATFATEGANVTLAGDINAAKVTVNSSVALAFGSHSLMANTIEVNGGKLAIDGGVTTENPITVASGAEIEFKNVLPGDGRVVTGKAEDNAGAVILNNTGNEIALQSVNAITGAVKVVKTGASKTTISRVQSYTGGTKVQEGIVGIANDNALGSGEIELAGGQITMQDATHTLTNAINVTSDSSIHTQGNNLTNSAAFTVSADAKITKQGTGTLVFNNPANPANIAGALNIAAGTVQFYVNATSAGNTTLAAVTMAQGTVLNQKPTAVTTVPLKIGSLTLTGNAELQSNGPDHGTVWKIDELISDGDTSRTLTINDMHKSNAQSLYEFAGENTEGKFTGEINIQQNQEGSARHVGVVISNGAALENAVVHYSKATGTGADNAKTQLSLAINTPNAKVAGLSTEGLTLGANQCLDVFSGTVVAKSSGSNDGRTYFNIAANNSTLEITNTVDCTFSGRFENVDIVKSGAGKQVLTGVSSSFAGTVTVNGGTLGLGNGASFNTGTITVNEGATLEVDTAFTSGAVTVEEGATLNIIYTGELTPGACLVSGNFAAVKGAVKINGEPATRCVVKRDGIYVQKPFIIRVR